LPTESVTTATAPAASAPPVEKRAIEPRPTDGVAGQLTPGDRRFLWVVGGIIVLLACAYWARLSGWGLREVEIDRLPERQFDFRVDVNRATWVEWMQLEGIGEVTARRIVEDRETRGPFRSIDDVDRVSGIGPKTMEAIRPWLTWSELESVESP
jgi:competence protein ComEA